MRPIRHLHLDPSKRIPLLRDQNCPEDAPEGLRVSKTHTAPSSALQSSSHSASTKPEDASVYFIGNATTIIEWQGLRILTDPNFLHAGDHVHLGPGVTAQRLKNPAVDLHELPPVDLVLLSHYHEDHFDRFVEDKLNRDFDIVTTPHARGCLTSEARYTSGGSWGLGYGSGKKEEEGKQDGRGPFRAVHDVDTFESIMLHIDDAKQGQLHMGGYGMVPVIKITAMPGKHVPPGALGVANDLLGAVPPTNGWLLEMGWSVSTPSTPSATTGRGGHVTKTDSQSSDTGYRIYISGDTLFVDELREIPKHIREQQLVQYPHSSRSSRSKDGPGTEIDLMIVHLGGTTIPGPMMPLLMVTMDARQGVELMRLLNPDLTIPVHFDDYSVMLSPLSDFKAEVAKMGEGWMDRVIYLERGEQFRFRVRGSM
ncbi:Metallo-hydrolase/oxidoreductase [Xylaria castorea]|nr:Metallo-hydrolase/oxidoreductase [Xylaria castorea]